MLAYVTITSQGQISIPAKFRKVLGLKKSSKAIIELEDGKLIIRPSRDLLEMGGMINEKAVKYKPLSEVQKLEKEAWGKAVEDKFKDKA
jgi:AbrB family looped-hinge helix DNA binding protein